MKSTPQKLISDLNKAVFEYRTLKKARDAEKSVPYQLKVETCIHQAKTLVKTAFEEIKAYAMIKYGRMGYNRVCFHTQKHMRELGIE